MFPVTLGGTTRDTQAESQQPAKVAQFRGKLSAQGQLSLPFFTISEDEVRSQSIRTRMWLDTVSMLPARAAHALIKRLQKSRL